MTASYLMKHSSGKAGESVDGGLAVGLAELLAVGLVGSGLLLHGVHALVWSCLMVVLSPSE